MLGPAELSHEPEVSRRPHAEEIIVAFSRVRKLRPGEMRAAGAHRAQNPRVAMFEDLTVERS